MDARIIFLISVHVVAFFVAATSASNHTGPDPAPIAFLALISADAALLGLWGAIGHTRWQLRLCVVSAALVFFWATFLFQERNPRIEDALLFAAIISLPCIVIFLVIGALHRGSRQLALRRATDVSGREGFQFSLRGLLVAVTFVATALSVGKATHTMGNSGHRLRILAIVLTLPPSFVFVALATFWAALGLGRPLPRLLAVVPCAFVVGFTSLFGFSEFTDWWQFLLWSSLTGTMCIVIVVSLLVVRSVGWRLCSATDERKLGSIDVPSVPDASLL